MPLTILRKHYIVNERHGESSCRELIPPEVLVHAYARGLFPMAQARHDPDVRWYELRMRGIIPMDRFRVSRKIDRLIRRSNYEWSVNRDFAGVIEACADREQTWISDRIIDSYKELHRQGFAHSVEIWQGGSLAAGLYGVALQSAFFAESLFQREPEMSKVALYYCHKRLLEAGYMLWDVQFYTSHLAQFGCIEIRAGEYSKLLSKALGRPARFDR